jgi:hypothetical protein
VATVRIARDGVMADAIFKIAKVAVPMAIFVATVVGGVAIAVEAISVAAVMAKANRLTTV